MTTTIKAEVRKRRGQWYALAYTTPLVNVPYLGDVPEMSDSRGANSWPEAMQQAQVLRANLDDALMDQVHESRARRRTVTIHTTEASA